MKKIFLKEKRGFTLVEALVAISIFTVSLLGLMSVLASRITDIASIKQRTTASYLAQEGIEYTRSMRDTFVLYDTTSADNGWNRFNTKFSQCSATGNGCTYDDRNIDFGGTDLYGNINNSVTNIPVGPCSSSGPTGCAELLYFSSNGRYNLYEGLPSGYRRRITVTPVPGNSNEDQITSTVYWTQGSGPKSISFSENLFKWIQ